MSRPLNRITPLRWRACPSSVRNKVDFPTPLRPSSAKDEPAASEKPISSMMVESPYPAQSDSTWSRPCLLVIVVAQIDPTHIGIGGDLLRHALPKQLAGDKNRYFLRETEHEFHVVLDEQHGDIPRQIFDRGEQRLAILRRNACRRFVQQQDFWARRQSQNDFSQPLLSIGQFTHLAIGNAGQSKTLQKFPGLLRLGPAPRQQAGWIAQQSFAPANRQYHGLERGEAWENGGHLKRPRQALPDPLSRRHPCDFLAV